MESQENEADIQTQSQTGKPTYNDHAPKIPHNHIKDKTHHIPGTHTPKISNASYALYLSLNHAPMKKIPLEIKNGNLR